METKSRKKRLEQLFFLFLVYSFLGWVIETTFVAILTHEFTSRGYLFVREPLAHYFPSLRNIPLFQHIPLIFGLPMIEIFGFGCLILIYCFRKLKNRPFILFLCGTVSLTLLELAASYLCSNIFHKTYWDYSAYPLNFQGRICLFISLAWGLGSVLIITQIQPWLNRHYHKLCGHKNFALVINIFIVLTLFCALLKYWWFPNTLG